MFLFKTRLEWQLATQKVQIRPSKTSLVTNNAFTSMMEHLAQGWIIMTTGPGGDPANGVI